MKSILFAATAVAMALMLNLAAGAQLTPSIKQDASDAAGKPAEPVSAEKRLADMQKQLDGIERKLDELIAFMGGGRQLSSFDTVDRRFRDINDKLDRMQRDIDRLR